MSRVAIYSPDGREIDSLNVPGDIKYDSGRTWFDGDVYYKGVGAKYLCHFSFHNDEHGTQGPADVFYAGFLVKNPNLVGKSGIFSLRYQPYFSDWIGSCGPKEEKIVENSMKFSLSAVEVVDRFLWDKENNQTYYTLKYKHKRDRFLPYGRVEDLIELIRVMVRTGWNFPWDKTAIRDVTIDGKVSDVADMFRSTKLEHRIGTVYSLLYSLLKLAPEKYADISDSTPIYATVSLLDNLGIALGKSIKKCRTPREISTAALRLLVSGRTCAGIEDNAFGMRVRAEYERLLNEQIGGL